MHHIGAISSRMKVEQENSTTKLIYSNNWNGPVLYICIVVSTHTLGPVHSRWVVGGWGCWLKFLSILLVLIRTSIRCIQSQVWQWAFIVLLADPQQKWTCLARASTCFWTQGNEYIIQQVTQSTLFQLVHGTGNFISDQYMGTFTGKNGHIYASLLDKH